MPDNNTQQWIAIPGGAVTLEAGGTLAEPTAFDVAPFAISRCPVTNAQYEAFVAAGGYSQRQWWPDGFWAVMQKYHWTEPRYWGDQDWNRPDCPVVGVSWYEALAFCQWLSATEDAAITLPTEQQWQRAAQGDDGREFPWGCDEPTINRCNWNRAVDETTPVTRYPDGASPYGVLDMSGNVWEWTLTPCANDASSNSDDAYLLRGGCWSSDSPISLRAAHRSPKDPNTRLAPGYRNHVTVGFRLARP